MQKGYTFKRNNFDNSNYKDPRQNYSVDYKICQSQSKNENANYLAVGPQGPQGSIGKPGEVGCKGPRGQDGCKGPKGCKGDTGEKGAIGKPGPIGKTGEMGSIGPRGDPGFKGEQGCHGGNSMIYCYQSYTGTDPDSGSISFDEPTEYYRDQCNISLSFENSDGINIEKWVLNVKPHDTIKISSLCDSSKFGIYNITGYNEGSCQSFNLELITSHGTFSEDEKLLVTVIPSQRIIIKELGGSVVSQFVFSGDLETDAVIQPASTSIVPGYEYWLHPGNGQMYKKSIQEMELFGLCPPLAACGFKFAESSRIGYAINCGPPNNNEPNNSIDSFVINIYSYCGIYKGEHPSKVGTKVSVKVDTNSRKCGCEDIKKISWSCGNADNTPSNNAISVSIIALGDKPLLFNTNQVRISVTVSLKNIAY